MRQQKGEHLANIAVVSNLVAILDLFFFIYNFVLFYRKKERKSSSNRIFLKTFDLDFWIFSALASKTQKFSLWAVKILEIAFFDTHILGSISLFFLNLFLLYIFIPNQELLLIWGIYRIYSNFIPILHFLLNDAKISKWANKLASNKKHLV